MEANAVEANVAEGDKTAEAVVEAVEVVEAEVEAEEAAIRAVQVAAVKAGTDRAALPRPPLWLLAPCNQWTRASAMPH